MNQNFYSTKGISKNFMALKGEATIFVASKELLKIFTVSGEPGSRGAGWVSARDQKLLGMYTYICLNVMCSSGNQTPLQLACLGRNGNYTKASCIFSAWPAGVLAREGKQSPWLGALTLTVFSSY
jgi:hypothetical protein